jgi:hypothetical protein
MSDKTAVICFEEDKIFFSFDIIVYGSEKDFKSQEKSLYTALRKADDIGAQTVLIHACADQNNGLGVYNRLLRATGFKEIKL